MLDVVIRHFHAGLECLLGDVGIHLIHIRGVQLNRGVVWGGHGVGLLIDVGTL